jgi:hypothetical protein
MTACQLEDVGQVCQRHFQVGAEVVRVPPEVEHCALTRRLRKGRREASALQPGRYISLVPNRPEEMACRHVDQSVIRI